mmetsp:Transcript_15475/g.25312  ORF Transcript_15475/g.25312 Transcript_15475/m.25312 type:complete len:302 (+) Transcript_15475:328-1233(+)
MLKMFGKPPFSMGEQTEIEHFISNLVACFTAFGIAEQEWDMSTKSTDTLKHLVFCQQQLRIELGQLVEILVSSPVVLERVLALLAHHNFRKYGDEKTSENTRQRLRELSNALKQAWPGDETKVSYRDTISAFLEKTSLMEQLCTPKVMHQSQISQESCWIRAAEASSEKTKLCLRDFSASIARSKNQVFNLSARFQAWKTVVWNKKHASTTISFYFRLLRQRLLARAFGKLSRHAIFLRALSLAARNGSSFIKDATEHPKRKQYSNRRKNDESFSFSLPRQKPLRHKPTSDKGRPMPWESY